MNLTESENLLSCSMSSTRDSVNLTEYVHFLFLCCREFAMSTTFPRREFTSNHDSQTVGDLHLVPSAVILILPVRLSVLMFGL